MTIVKRSIDEFVNSPELCQTLNHPSTNDRSTHDTVEITASAYPFVSFPSIGILSVTRDSVETIYNSLSRSFRVQLELVHSSNEESVNYSKSIAVSGKIDVGKCSTLAIDLDVMIIIENGTEETEMTPQLLEPHYGDPEFEGTFLDNTAISPDAVLILFQ